MKELSYLCNVCNAATFSLDNLEEAKLHSKIPINEGEYHGMILKESYKRELGDNASKYLILIKTDKLDGEHKRVYDLIQTGDYSKNPLDAKYEKSFNFSTTDYFDIISLRNDGQTLSLDSIDIKVKGNMWKGLNEDELSKLVKILETQRTKLRKSYYTKKLLEVDEFKTI